MPLNYSITTGFIVRQTEVRPGHELSTQADLIIYDNSYPVLFREGDFAIVTADSVRAIIEVKTDFQVSTLKETLDKATKMGHLILRDKENTKNCREEQEEDELDSIKERKLFNGIFYYDNSKEKSDDIIDKTQEYIKQSHKELEALCKYKYAPVNHICITNNLFYKHWPQNNNGDRHKIYELEDLSYSFFISNLIAFLAPATVKDNNHIWYPVDKIFSARHYF